MKKKIGYFFAVCIFVVSLTAPVMARPVGWWCHFNPIVMDCYALDNTCYCFMMDPWNPE